MILPPLIHLAVHLFLFRAVISQEKRTLKSNAAAISVPEGADSIAAHAAQLIPLPVGSVVFVLTYSVVVSAGTGVIPSVVGMDGAWVVSNVSFLMPVPPVPPASGEAPPEVESPVQPHVLNCISMQ